MKNLIRLFSLALFLQMGVMAVAQDTNPKKMMRKANSSLSSYFMNPINNEGNLDEARDLMDQVVANDEFANDSKAHNLRGDVYNALSGKVTSAIAMGQSSVPDENIALIAYESYTRAYENADKQYLKKDALKGLTENASYLSAMGNAYVGNLDYGRAYHSYEAVLDIEEILQENNEKSVFPDKENLLNQKYIIAVCATQIGKEEEAKAYLHDLYSNDYNEPQVYSLLFSLLNAEGNSEEAAKVMTKGKELFPGNTNILFAEINYLIQNEEYTLLEEKLQEAIAKDPNNPSVRSALGNVYMNLNQESEEAGNAEEAEDYFHKAIDYFNQAIDIDPHYFDAIYSIGMMYFNKAAAFTQEMQTLDLREQKRYDELDGLVKDYFGKALPYFKLAESLNPNDRNTLLGLREILARMNQLEDSEGIKARLDAIQEGERFDNSYFD